VSISDPIIIVLTVYIIITVTFFIAILFESVKKDLDTNTAQVLIAPFWFIIVIWYLISLAKEKLKRK
jgi:hypothetical protein